MTLTPVLNIIQEHAYMLRNICATSEKDYREQKETIDEYFAVLANKIRDLYPQLLQINYDEDMSAKDAEKVLKNILRYNSTNYSIEKIFEEEILAPDNHDDYWAVPGIVELFEDGIGKKFYIENDTDSLNTLLFNMLISLPKGALNFTFVDFSLSGLGSEFMTSLHANGICNDIITDKAQFQALLKQLGQRQIDALQKYGNVVEYNKKHHTIAMPYEVIVLLDYPKEYDEDNNILINLFKNGHKSGLNFVLYSSNEEDFANCKMEDALASSFYNYNDYIGEHCIESIKPTYLYDIDSVKQAVFNYYGSAIEEKEDAAVQDVEELNNSEYSDYTCNMTIPIGSSSDGKVEFRFDTVSHPHAFIIGQSGSGKSVLLHNIVSSMILKYTPEDLQLYLLDFKMGGVEFNRYRTIKHVKALLVDNSDIQITLEILRDIDNQMKERGKMLRNAGVANIKDYNEKNKDTRMPAIVLVADECHIMFSTQDSKSRRIQSEISNIITKIAKEGRSQGVHLLLATQTLAGTEIANEIMNNITDHYLLKCAASDSEKMASDSSKITSQLSTGQVFYHHTDEQVQFKAFYSKNEELAERITCAVNKSAECQSNGQFYFNGSQVFTVDKDVIKYVGKKGRSNPTVALGRGISLEEKPISITLKEDYSENIMLFGINNAEQVTRVTMNILMTMASSVRQKDMDMDIYVFDCLNNEDGIYAEPLDEMEDMGLCKIVSGRKRGSLLKQLAEDIASGKAKPSTLFILGQEKFRELRMDMEIEENKSADGGGLFSGLDFSNSNDSKTTVKTYQEALRYILEHGSEAGVHTVLQLDKPDKLLFSDYSVSAKEVFRMFKHLVMLHSDENAASRLIDNEIKLESLSGDNERLRAYYYSEEEDKYTLFTPYDMPTKEKLSKLLD